MTITFLSWMTERGEADTGFYRFPVLERPKENGVTPLTSSPPIDSLTHSFNRAMK
jgi:hypothetical protein